jgi:poly(3-hydroxybutyrate) depolymerase
MADANDFFGTQHAFLPAKPVAKLFLALAVLPLGLGCSANDGPGTSGGSGATSASAGQSASAGAVSSSEGMPGSNASGAANGGAASGGAANGAGGAPAGGDTSRGGAGGVSSSAGGGAGGSAGNQDQGSPGCGAPSPLQSGNFTETVDGTMRHYVLDVPSDYDEKKKYRLIFVWHPLGGSAGDVVNADYNGLKSLSAGSAIFVSADGLQGSNAEASGRGWWNVNNGDMKLLTAILAKLEASLCIDRQRIFSTGFSFGGMMSYTVGYEFDVFRAIAPCSGDLQVIPHEERFTAPLPIMAFHGDNDDFVTTARGRAARDKYLARNKCGAATVPASPSPCVEYQGCSAPTFWCEFPGGHTTWSQQPQAIWKFFSQF